MINPFDEIMEWYQTAYDAMRVTRRVIHRNQDKRAVTARHVFFDLAENACDVRLNDAIRELENVVILTLVAVFERTLRVHVLDRIRSAVATADPVGASILRALEDDVEFWKFSERLIDVFVSVPATERGNVK